MIKLILNAEDVARRHSIDNIKDAVDADTQKLK
jgi:hypothetical protein